MRECAGGSEVVLHVGKGNEVVGGSAASREDDGGEVPRASDSREGVA